MSSLTFTERQQQQMMSALQERMKAAIYIGTFIFLLILLRFYQIQIIRGSFFHEMSESNRLALVRVKTPRGMIFDRKGRILVSNRPSFHVSVILENIQDLERTENMLVKSLGLDKKELRRRLTSLSSSRHFEPIKVKEDISRLELAFLETMKADYPGLIIEAEPRRYYPEGQLAAHVLGYVGEINRMELGEKRKLGYQMGDFVGKSGLEKVMDPSLKGIDGGQQVEVDSMGRHLKILNNWDYLPGDNLVLTIDLEIQRLVEKALGKAKGAVVVMDSRNGEILAAASHPPFNPNLFAGGISSDNWMILRDDENHPLQNRIIQSQYPPGSVYKLITAIAGLGEGIVDEDSIFTCRGRYWFGNRYYRCWKKEGHGQISLHRAIVESCDVFFYQLGEMLGVDLLAQYAREMGLGDSTGLDLPGEWSGLIPDTEWKRKVKGEIWYPGETLSTSIGQGYNLVTPIQITGMISGVANGGDIYRPMLVRSVLSPDSKVIKEFFPEKTRRAKIGHEVFEIVRRGMFGSVNEPHGTGWRARVAKVSVAGKTGTAQVIRISEEEEEKELEEIPEKFRDHAWFACFAPYDNPQVAVVVLVEHGGHGGSAAAPIAAEIIKGMFKQEYFLLAGGDF